MTRTGQRRTRTLESINGDYRSPFQQWRMTPPTDGPPLTDSQVANCCRDVRRALELGCWYVAILCVERARSGTVLTASDEELTRRKDGPKLTAPIAETVARTVETWLKKATLATAVSVIRRRREDVDFIGPPLVSSDRIEELIGDKRTARAMGCGLKSLGELAHRFEVWSKNPGTIPKCAQREWFDVARALINAGLAGPETVRRVEESGKNSKERSIP